jgi:molecular chaperone HtpG
MTMQEKGNISIHTENIFPIIKKFLYSDHEIFLRELVSNAVDASQKLKRLSAIGEYAGELGELKVKVSFDKDARTITISDSGIGMTADEVKSTSTKLPFLELLSLLKNTRIKVMKKLLLVTSDLAFTLPLWLLKE